MIFQRVSIRKPEGFEENLQSASHTILNQIDRQKNLETDGKL